jgi:hypothetical protein
MDELLLPFSFAFANSAWAWQDRGMGWKVTQAGSAQINHFPIRDQFSWLSQPPVTSAKSALEPEPGS